MPYRGVWGDSAYFRVDKKLNSAWQMSEVAAVSSAAGRCHSVRGWRCVRSIVPLPRNVKINCETRAVLLMLRTYALYNRSRQVVGLLAAISAIGTGITVVRLHSHTHKLALVRCRLTHFLSPVGCPWRQGEVSRLARRLAVGWVRPPGNPEAVSIGSRMPDTVLACSLCTATTAEVIVSICAISIHRTNWKLIPGARCRCCSGVELDPRLRRDSLWLDAVAGVERGSDVEP